MSDVTRDVTRDVTLTWRGGRPRGAGWGPWRLDGIACVLYCYPLTGGGYAYEVDLECCTSSARVLDRIAQVAGKTWADETVVTGLVRALDDVLRLQGSLCGSGWDRQLTPARIRALITACCRAGAPCDLRDLSVPAGRPHSRPAGTVSAMGRGLGPAQRRALEMLAAEAGWLTVGQLSERLDLTPRRGRALVATLETRGLVVTERGCIGWAGAGSYGRARTPGQLENARRYGDWVDWDQTGELKTVTVRAGEPWPGMPGFVATRDVDLVRSGMPVHGLRVWHPDRYREAQERLRAHLERLTGLLSREIDAAPQRLAIEAGPGEPVS